MGEGERWSSSRSSSGRGGGGSGGGEFEGAGFDAKRISFMLSLLPYFDSRPREQCLLLRTVHKRCCCYCCILFLLDSGGTGGQTNRKVFRWRISKDISLRRGLVSLVLQGWPLLDPTLCSVGSAFISRRSYDILGSGCYFLTCRRLVYG